MTSREELLKEAASVVKRLADFSSGESRCCVFCSKEAIDVIKIGRCVYIEVEEWRDCPAFQQSSDAIQKVAEYGGKWICRQYQGTLPKWTTRQAPADKGAEQLTLFD